MNRNFLRQSKNQKKRKEAFQYYFTVEGQCEKLYLEHLEKLINNNNNASNRVKFTIQVGLSPKSALKRFTSFNSKSILYCVWDREKEDECMNKKFEDYLNEIDSISSKISARPAFSHLSFELWILLHKRDLRRNFTDVSQYCNYINRFFEQEFQTLKKYKEKRNFEIILGKISLNDIVKAVQYGDSIRKNNENNQKTKIQVKQMIGYNSNPDLMIHEAVKTILLDCRLM